VGARSRDEILLANENGTRGGTFTGLFGDGDSTTSVGREESSQANASIGTGTGSGSVARVSIKDGSWDRTAKEASGKEQTIALVAAILAPSSLGKGAIIALFVRSNNAITTESRNLS